MYVVLHCMNEMEKKEKRVNRKKRKETLSIFPDGIGMPKWFRFMLMICLKINDKIVDMSSNSWWIQECK